MLTWLININLDYTTNIASSSLPYPTTTSSSCVPPSLIVKLKKNVTWWYRKMSVKFKWVQTETFSVKFKNIFKCEGSFWKTRPNFTNVGSDRDPILQSYDPILQSHVRSYQLRSGKFFRGGIVGSCDPTTRIAILITMV